MANGYWRLNNVQRIMSSIQKLFRSQKLNVDNMKSQLQVQAKKKNKNAISKETMKSLLKSV